MPKLFVVVIGLGLSGSALAQDVSFQRLSATSEVVESGKRTAVRGGDLRLLESADRQFESLVFDLDDNRPIRETRDGGCMSLLLAAERIHSRKFERSYESPVLKISGIFNGIETVCRFDSARRAVDDNAALTPAGPFCTDHGVATADDGTTSWGSCN